MPVSLYIDFRYIWIKIYRYPIYKSTFLFAFWHIYILKSDTLNQNISMNTAEDFWKRVDNARGNKTLKEIAEELDGSYITLLNQRSQNRYPSRANMMRIAEILGTSLDSLVSDSPGIPKITPEMDYVRRNKRAEWIVHKCMTGDRMLAILYSFVECLEKEGY